MSPVSELIVSFSLCLNGIWLATHVIRWTRQDAARLRNATLALLGLVVLLGALVPVVVQHSALFTLDKAATGVALPCCLWCAAKLNDWLPRPWGNGPRRRRARTR